MTSLMSRRHCLLILLFTIFAVAPAAGSSDFEYGPRPPSSIFDPTRFLSTEVAEEISKPLATYRSKEAIDIIVVILPDFGDAPPEHVARQFADAWCTPSLHGIVLHVPGRTDGPWIVPGGKIIRDLLDPRSMAVQVAQAKHRAAREPNDIGKIRAASTEAADLLRIWMGKSISREEQIRQQQANFRELVNRNFRWRKLLLPAALTATVLSGVVVYVAWFTRKKLRARVFPKTKIQPRLGAPYAGGNDACVDLGPPDPHP